MRQSRKSRKKAVRTRKKSNAGLIIGLAFCLVCGVAAGFYLGGFSGERLHSSYLQRTQPEAQDDTEEPKSSKGKTADSGDSSEQPAQTPPSTSAYAPLPSPSAGTGEISYVENNEKKIALTFDAGASAEPVEDLLTVLGGYNLHVTFFMTGKWCEQYPDMVKRIFDAGHEIANHTYDHKDLRKLDNTGISEELERMAGSLEKVTGKTPVALARPPFGSRDTRVLEQIRADGYIPIYWSLDSFDSVKKDITAEEIRNRILNKIKSGDIVLMHCGSRPTADAVEDIIGTLLDRGYSIVSVSQLINSKS